jgi:sugar O-acyltransferase (sialic acid O-acetyltransferase NeuD family)
MVDGLREPGTGYKDATSVYGYAGPVVSKRETPGTIVKKFQRALFMGLQDMKVVNLFTRLHPLLQNHDILNGLGDCREEGFTVSIDTSLSPELQCAQYRRNHKENIKKLRALGITCRETTAEEDVRIFIEIYDQAMKRVGAPSTYFFPPSWYAGILKSKEATTRLFLYDLDGRSICGGLVAMCKGLVELHLAGVANEYVRLSPLKLLFDDVRDWSVQRDAYVLHLGGGIGAKADSLYQFKTGFSLRRHIFQTWRWVLNQSVHDRLVEARVQFEQKNRFAILDGFFPRYRAPIITQKALQENLVTILAPSAPVLLPAEGKKVPQETMTPRIHSNVSMATEFPSEQGDKNDTEQHLEQRGAKLRILILGGGGHAQVIADAVLSRSAKHEGLDVVGFLDDDPALVNKRILGKPVLGKLEDLTTVSHDAVVIGIGDNELRRRLFEELSSQGETLATIVHPRATMARNVKMGRGTVVFAGVVVNTGSKIGDNVILNTGCTVDHECEVKSHTHVCPGAHLGGAVTIGEGAFIGIGSTIIHNKRVGDWATVGGGALVIRDVSPRTTVVGVPAHVLNR